MHFSVFEKKKTCITPKLLNHRQPSPEMGCANCEFMSVTNILLLYIRWCHWASVWGGPTRRPTWQNPDEIMHPSFHGLTFKDIVRTNNVSRRSSTSRIVTSSAAATRRRGGPRPQLAFTLHTHPHPHPQSHTHQISEVWWRIQQIQVIGPEKKL
jgi:hypothetical protein